MATPTDRRPDTGRPAGGETPASTPPPARLRPVPNKIGEPPGNLERRAKWFQRRAGKPAKR